MTRERLYRVAVGVTAALLVVGTGAIATSTTPGGSTTVQETTTTTAATDSGLALRNLTAPESIRVGTAYTVSATVVNRDDEPATEDVYYEITGNVIAAKSVRIPANGTTSVRFDVVENDTAGFPTGTYTHGIYTANASVSANVTLVEGTATPTATTEAVPAETTTVQTATTVEPTATTTGGNVTTAGAEVTTAAAEPADETATTTTAAVEVTATPEETATETTTTATETAPGETPTATTAAETTEAEPVRTANVTFLDQDTRGTNLTVESVALPEGGFVVIHNGGIVEGQVVESIVGRSDYLAPGMHRNVTVTLDDPLNESQRLFAVVYRDSNDNREFDFVTSNRTVDGPYTKVDSPEAVNAIAVVEVVRDDRTPTATTTGNETA